MSSDIVFTKENLDTYLKELAKEIKKSDRSGMTSEIILIGGAAVLANYGFRDMTTDIDAVFRTMISVKDAINRVGDKFNLPNGWLNTDFMKTSSYSKALAEVSTYYKTFSNILEVRTVSAEYLIAMKLKAGRRYKNDLSDIIGILAEHEKRGASITFEQIDAAVIKLYGGWDGIDADIRRFVEEAVQNGQYSELYSSVRDSEKESKTILIHFEKEYPNAANESNVNDILASLKAKKASAKESILDKLKNSEPSKDKSGKTHSKNHGDMEL